MIDEDIPNLSRDGIQLDNSISNACFFYTYSVQSSSISDCPFSSLDADALRNFICFNSPPTGRLVQSRAEFLSLPVDVKDVWVQSFDSTGITSLPFHTLQSLRNLVVGNTCFCGMQTFELSGLPSLESIEMGKWCFFAASSFSLSGWMTETVDIRRSFFSSEGCSWWLCIPSLPFGSV